MTRGIEDVLAECLDRIDRGEATIDDVLESHPSLSAEQRPLLILALELRSISPVSAPASLRGWKRPIFAARPSPSAMAGGWWPFPRPAFPAFGWAASMARLAAGLMAMVLLLGGTMVATAGSLPEEPLYPVKLAVESARMVLAADPHARAELSMEFATRRLEEVERAARQGKPEAVERGLALFQERIDSALKVDQEPIPVGEREQQRVEEILKHNHQVLERVVSQVENPRARAAVQQALERVEERVGPPGGGADLDEKRTGKPDPASGRPLTPGPIRVLPPPAATGTPTQQEASGAAPDSAIDTATVEPVGGAARKGPPEVERPEKAQGHEEKDQKANEQLDRGREARGERRTATTLPEPPPLPLETVVPLPSATVTGRAGPAAAAGAVTPEMGPRVPTIRGTIMAERTPVPERATGSRREGDGQESEAAPGRRPSLYPTDGRPPDVSKPSQGEERTPPARGR